MQSIADFSRKLLHLCRRAEHAAQEADTFQQGLFAFDKLRVRFENHRAVEAILEAQEQLRTQCGQCAAVRAEVEAAIARVPGQRDQEILRRRYILGQKWEQIAVEMHYGYQYVCKCHKLVVTQLAIECDS